ncbi:MAG TPA: hypothetical protein VKG87_13115, partial [Terriglobales bacterium]|nr:hypothetical protein [Terriglobales bacterium]
AFQAVPNVAQVTIAGVQDAQLTINDIYFEASGAITGPSLTNLATNVASWVGVSLAPLLSEDWSSVAVRAIDLSSATGLVGEAPAGGPGGVASEAAPNNVAACVSFRTAQRGRSGRGRNYVPGIPNVAVTLNTLAPTFISDLVDAYFILVGAGSFTPGWEMVVVSRQTAGALRPTGIAIPVTDIRMVTPYVRSMRSREVGHGA